MMKRGVFSSSKKKILAKAEAEHELFKYKMLASLVKDVYEKCSEIRFYECIYEYFRYCESVPEEYIEACLKESEIFQALWRTYMENEYLKADTWEDIEELIAVLMERQNQKKD